MEKNTKGTLRVRMFTAEFLTEYVRDLIFSGKLKTAFDIIVDGGIPEEVAFEMLCFKWKFVDSFDEEGTPFISVMEDCGITTEEVQIIGRNLSMVEGDEDFELAKKVYVDYMDELTEAPLIAKIRSMMDVEVFSYNDVMENSKRVKNSAVGSSHSFTGVIFPNGVSVTCDYMEHKSLYSDFVELGLTDNGDPFANKELNHISKGFVQDQRTFAVEIFGGYNEVNENYPLPSIRQCDLMLALDIEMYGDCGGNFQKDLLRVHNYLVGKGAKYGNLLFLKKYFKTSNETSLKLPTFQLNRPESTDGWAIRTSPKHSIAGVLNSIFDITDSSEAEMISEFEQYKDIREGNELHFFYQKIEDGFNGVANYDGIDLAYSVSFERGAVVGGKKEENSLTLPDNQVENLKNLCDKLSKKFKSSVQIEFVLNSDGITIVQLRLMDFITEYMSWKPTDVLFDGTGFSKGMVTCTKDEVLIVEGECDSKELLGKKAVIYVSKEPKVFAHIMVLAQTLEIPAIVLPEKPELPDGELFFNCDYVNAYIKIKD